jgi:hypothetical protein
MMTLYSLSMMGWLGLLFVTVGVFSQDIELMAPKEKPFHYAWNNDTKAFVETSIAKSTEVNDIPNPKERMIKTFAQINQDIILLKMLRQKKNGYFVDLAANHFRTLSNTYLLELYHNWKGICIEANPMYWSSISTYRRCTLFSNPVSNGFNKVKFRLRGAGGGIVSDLMDNKATPALFTKDAMVDGEGNRATETEFVTVTLNSILDYAKAPAHMDFLSLDVEGNEDNVLSAFDFHRYKFSIINIERPSKKTHMLLRKNGYHFIAAHSSDIFYFHEDAPNVEALRTRATKNRSKSNIAWGGESRQYILE